MTEATTVSSSSGGDSPTEVDPVTYQVVGCAMESACREMGVTTVRTATSPIIVDVYDFSCAILDSDGKLVATANYDPSHLAGMPFAVEAAIWEYGRTNIRPGDVIIHNDPYLGGTHLPDFTVIKPLFIADELIGFAANRAHHVDVGGKSPGGLAPDARSIYAEGLRVPVVKWYAEGEENTDLFQLLLINVRLPELQEADFRAQLASCVTAEVRVAELCERYGATTIRDVMAARQDHSERITRGLVSRLPDGVYTHEDFLDDDGNDARASRIRATVSIAGSELLVDFSGTSAQALGPTNSAYGMTCASVFISLLQLAPAGMAFNSGCFRCVDVTVPRGTLLSPQPPAPVFAGTVEACLRSIDTILGAITRAAPRDLVAGTYGTAFCVGGGGSDPATRGEYAFFFAMEGGWGAAVDRDGWNCTPNQSSNYKDTPVEVIEQNYPLLCHAVRLRCDSGGPGRTRGGVGVERIFEVVRGDMTVDCFSDRFRTRPYGVFGGLPGESNTMLVQPSGAGESLTFREAFATTSPSKFSDIDLHGGDRFTIATGGGGGYGSPLERDPELVRLDVEEGLVSREQALDFYGVVFNASSEVNLPATKGARDASAAKWADSPPFPVTATGLSVDPEYTRLQGDSKLTVDPSVDDVSGLITGARMFLDTDYCAGSCPRKGDALLCPWHSETALDMLSVDTYRRWTKRQCPQKAALLRHLPHNV